MHSRAVESCHRMRLSAHTQTTFADSSRVQEREHLQFPQSLTADKLSSFFGNYQKQLKVASNTQKTAPLLINLVHPHSIGFSKQAPHTSSNLRDIPKQVRYSISDTELTKTFFHPAVHRKLPPLNCAKS